MMELENIKDSQPADDNDDPRNLADKNADGGPGLLYLPYMLMEELAEKLKLLKCDIHFCRELHQKPICRHYFALVTNSGEQFNCFSVLSAWLIQMCGRKMELPQEADDPNAVIATILHNLRALSLKPDFPPNKLKSGCGQFCIWVLNQLADEALKAKHFSWNLPAYPAEDDILEDFQEEEPDLLYLGRTEKSEDDQIQEAEDYDDEEHILGLDEIKIFNSQMKTAVEEKKLEEIMESTTDVAEWKLEVERVLPQLKIATRSDNKDWRIHLEHMDLYQNNIEAATKDIKIMLGRLSDEIVASMEKIASREKYINQQLRNSLALLTQTRNALAEIKEIYRQVSSGVAEKTRQLAELSDELEHVKQEMEERGTSMTDGSQLVRIRQAIAKTQEENNQMDIRIGVLQHILLRYTLKTHKRFDADNGDKFLVY